jgi:hypothetical protein
VLRLRGKRGRRRRHRKPALCRLRKMMVHHRSRTVRPAFVRMANAAMPAWSCCLSCRLSCGLLRRA